MTNNHDEDDTPDLYDPTTECHARQTSRDIIGVTTHTHLCREYTDHPHQHLCAACGHTWNRTNAPVRT